MSPENKKVHSYHLYFALSILLIAVIYGLYGFNMSGWRHSPDFGWITMQDTGPNIVAEVFESGEKAGLRTGDTIKAINGKSYTTFDELYSNIRNNTPGSENVYTVERDGKTFTVSITNGRVGFARVLKRCGPLFFIGLIYVMIGALVFLMKPRALESWIFFIMTSIIGIKLTYAARIDLFHPSWLFDFRLLNNCLLPAPFIHFAIVFPKKRTLLVKNPWLWIIPYLFSVSMFVLYETSTIRVWDKAPVLDLLYLVYLSAGILTFLFSMIWNLLKSSSLVIRLQSQVILIGILLAFLIPVVDAFLRAYWNTYIFPDPTINFAVFLSFFPISIGYTIVKYDLFAIDTLVRRTYGYILSTASIVIAYALIVSGLNVTFQSSEISRSPLFSIVFALMVVFFFRPLHERFQGLVDRVFYRQRYDYRKTIKRISEAMTSILDPEQIYRTLIGSVVKEMFLENGLLLLLNQEKKDYQLQFVEGEGSEAIPSKQLARDALLLKEIQQKSDVIFRAEVELNPHYEENREILSQTFQSFCSELMLPMKYKDEMRGVISLGKKKSGKMFTPEDVDLLKTITNQSAIALENATLFKENLEKGRMEEELKIAHDIQVSMLPEQAPEIEGFTVVAESIAAREVGGDFYDFIETYGDGEKKKLAIVVGDVSGKAVSGALVMAATRSIFRVLSETKVSVKEVMSLGNARLKRDVKKGMFVALLYAALDSVKKTLTISNAGQTQPIVCSVDTSKPTYLSTEGDRFPLGILEDCDYQETKVELKSGDTVVFYTDGVVEAMNEKKEIYGFERFLRSIDEGRNLDAKTLLEKLVHDVLQYAGDVEQHDDITIVVAKVK